MYQITIKLKDTKIVKFATSYEEANIIVATLRQKYSQNYISFNLDNLDKPKAKTLKNKWKGNWG